MAETLRKSGLRGILEEKLTKLARAMHGQQTLLERRLSFFIYAEGGKQRSKMDF